MKYSAALLKCEVRVGGRKCVALVDTGCAQSIVTASHASGVEQGECTVVTVNGTKVTGIRESVVQLQVGSVTVRARCLVLEKLLAGFDVVLGMDIIDQLGLSVQGSRAVLGKVRCRPSAAVVRAAAPTVSLSDSDYNAVFDGSRWTVEWKWKSEPPLLHNKVAVYSMRPEIEEKFDAQIEKWKSNGWLQPCEDPGHGIVPLMAVEQPSKGKVRPVLDFRELNKYVHSYTGDADVCDETMRKWRSMPDSLGVLDLRDAYLQLHVRSDLQRFQVVKHRNNFYALTRLGFGLNCAPKIMSAVLNKVLSLDSRIAAATDHYVDDIVVDLSQVSMSEVVKHLKQYGLETKPPEKIDEARVLGLQLGRADDGTLCWSRGNHLPLVRTEAMSRRELFSTCRKLVGHYSVVGWLHVACSFVKRHCEGVKWDDDVGERARHWMSEIVNKVNENNPTKGVWQAKTGSTMKIWCDASSLALGVVVEIGGDVVEDASWLRKKDDGAHINVAELDAVVKGVNLAVKWQLRRLTLMTDSATVFSWLNSLLIKSHRMKTSGSAEMLVRRRLSIIGELRDEYELDISAELVKSAENKADMLTRVPQAWLRNQPLKSVIHMHRQHHFWS